MSENHCTMCGSELDEWDKIQNYSFNKYIGYGSKYDTETVDVKFCCHCFDKIVDYVIENSTLCPFRNLEEGE